MNIKTPHLTQQGTILFTNISEKTGVVKHPVDQIIIDEQGIQGDAHRGHWHRQISLLAQEDVGVFQEKTGININPGAFAENLLFSGIDLTKAQLLDRFIINDVVLELTQIGKVCHGDRCAIFKQVGQCMMPKKGVFCRVIRKGAIKPSDIITHKQRVLNVALITLSDRAFQGEYTDRSGNKAEEALLQFGKTHNWHMNITRALLPDEPQALKQHIDTIKDNSDIIFTLGSTGVGKRDIAPNVITPLCDKLIPGICEHIRFKYGQTNPKARLSASIAGMIGNTQIYTLPGSVKAVNEYLTEILTTLEHLVYMSKGLDVH